MKIEKTHIVYIQLAFANMQSRQDFLDLLNYTKLLIYGKDYIRFELKQITFYANPKNTNKAYKSFQIKKKSGAARTIYAPENGLKAIQKTLALILQCVFQPHEAAKGFVMGKSVVDNAKEHTGKNYVYNIDLKDFFPSIEQARVWACLKLKPFNLNENKSSGNNFDIQTVLLSNILVGVRKFSKHSSEKIKKTTNSRLKLANMIAAFSCAEMEVERKKEKGNWIKVKKSVLPQGAPTSPVFSNIICHKLDNRLTGVAKRFNLKYTRYADDITFSSMHNVYQENGDFLKELSRIINDQGFHIKESKTRLQKIGFRQEVTGLVVNDSVNVRKRYVKQVRMWLYYWEKYGYNKAEAIFLRDYFKDKGHVKKAKPNFQNVLSGKLEYLKMVKGLKDSSYLLLNNRFEKLSGYKSPTEAVLSDRECIMSEKGTTKGAISTQLIDLNFTVNEILEKGVDIALKNCNL